MPGLIHQTGELFVTVHLIGYGSVPILHSLLYLSLNPWEAPGWQLIAIDADVKQVITSWLQTLDNSVFTLEYKPWYRCGADVEMVVVTTLRSDVYHVLHMCHVLIKVTITFDVRVFVTLFFKFFFLYTFWADEFSVLNGGISLSFVDKFYNKLFVLVVTFTLLCPHNFVTCLS